MLQLCSSKTTTHHRATSKCRSTFGRLQVPEGGQRFLVVVVCRRDGCDHEGLRVPAQATPGVRRSASAWREYDAKCLECERDPKACSMLIRQHTFPSRIRQRVCDADDPFQNNALYHTLNVAAGETWRTSCELWSLLWEVAQTFGAIRVSQTRGYGHESSDAKPIPRSTASDSDICLAVHESPEMRVLTRRCSQARSLPQTR